MQKKRKSVGRFLEKSRSPLLEGKVAIITGAGSGIGRATALRMAHEGARVCLADVSEQGGKETMKMITNASSANGPAATFVKTDVSVEEQVERMVSHAVSKFGRLDVLFNNAGIYEWDAVDKIATETWDRIIGVNLRGEFLVLKHAIPHLKKTHGVVVNTSSSLGVSGALESVAYCASKSGVIGLTRASALDLAKYGIRVNCICPGSIDTSMQAREFGRSGNSDEMRKAYDLIYPVGRIGRPEEVASLVVFLASDESSFITGTPFLIDGGLYAQWGESLASRIDVRVWEKVFGVKSGKGKRPTR